jgi:hypothetical protein
MQNFNAGAFKMIKNDYAREIAKGNRVEFVHALKDFDSNVRPATVQVEYKMRDAARTLIREFSDSFMNEAGQRYVRRTY